MQMKGIDVSGWQGDIDFEQVKNSGIEFVIIKAGEWDHTVDSFEKNYAGAKAAGLHIGFYWFCDGKTISEISMEADACIKALEGKQFDFPIYMDLENQYQYDLGKDFCSNAVRTFCEKLEKAGYFTGLYTSTSWLDNVIEQDIKDKYTIWVADWRGYCGYDGKYGVWQYGAGYVPGINGKTDLNIIDIGYETDYPGVVIDDGVDLDYAYEDFPSLIIPNGFNNYPKPDDTAWDNDPCKDVGNTLDIRGYTPKFSGENWFLIDEDCEFTLETLPYANVNIYLVGGGRDGAEWAQDFSEPGREVFGIDLGGRGGCVLKKQIYITGNVECQAFVAKANNPTGTSVKIGNDLYKCTDRGYIHRKATASGNTKLDEGGNFNAESGANGVATPYGYVGSSGGGGGTYSIQNYQYIEVGAGKGGAGAGDGGSVKKNGTDATNYGCGGGAAGFRGFPSDGNVVETHAGRGMGGCIIFEILDSGTCDGSPNKPVEDDCSCRCECPRHEFECSDPAESSTHCEQEKNYKLIYEGDEPVITESTVVSPCVDNSQSNNTGENNGTADKSDCGCSKSYRGNSGGNASISNGSSCGCSGGNGSRSCGCGSGGNGKCVSYDVQKWGENWLLFDKSGEYSLTMDDDVTFTAYLVGGGSDGEQGIYYNKTAYGGNGGRGGCVNIIHDINAPKGQMDIIVRIGERGDSVGTSVVVNNSEYSCSGSGSTVNGGGFQGVSGRHGFRNADNGANGIETPFGYIGSSGGGGAAYCNGSTSGRGKGGLYAGNGGNIVKGKSLPGDRATGYGCGGGGGTASPTSWCSGGKGKKGCVIINW